PWSGYFPRSSCHHSLFSTHDDRQSIALPAHVLFPSHRSMHGRMPALWQSRPFPADRLLHSTATLLSLPVQIPELWPKPWHMRPGLRPYFLKYSRDNNCISLYSLLVCPFLYLDLCDHIFQYFCTGLKLFCLFFC